MEKNGNRLLDKQEIDKKIMFVIMIVAIILIPVYKIVTIKDTKIEKITNEIAKNKLAMYIEDGEGYKEYKKSDSFPVGYYLNIDKSKCEDINGNKIEASKVLSSKGNSVTVKSNKTIYCTLYFDYSETGEKEHPYRIEYIEDLVEIQVAVNNGETYEGKYFELTRNLDFQQNDSYQDYQTKEYGDINGNSQDEELKTELTSGTGWKPIGNNNTNPFQGTFDGKEHKILNLFINNNAEQGDSRYWYIGLFGVLKNATIKNLTLNGKINVTVARGQVGGFAGNISNNSLMENCHNETDIVKYNAGQAGGLIGWADSVTMKESTNKGSIKGDINLGGLIGVVSSTNSPQVVIENSHNFGAISAENGHNVGGLVGYTENKSNISNILIKNSDNNGDIIITGPLASTNAGGLIGRNDSAVIKFQSVHNSGKVIGDRAENIAIHLGGILGYSNGGTVDIIKSYNESEIRNKQTVYTTTMDLYIGGIVGSVINCNIKIIESYNNGELIGSTKVGGIIGLPNNSILLIDKCYNLGNISTTVKAGGNRTTPSGIIGYNHNSSKSYILNSYNLGNISGPDRSNGIAYEDYGATLTAINSYNAGKIQGNNSASGLFTTTDFNTKNNQFHAYNLFNRGSLDSTNKYGIFVSTDTNTFNAMKTIENVYYENSVSASNVVGVEGTSMSLNDMKNNTFVNLLNANKNKIDLSSIDSSLSEYTLCNWKLGESGYPEIDC